MSQSERCTELRDVAAELALGIADGEERARALEHLAECDECRRHVERLSAVADELSLIAPSEEPAAGFEQRAVAAMSPGRATARRPRRRFALPALAAAAAAAIGAGAVWFALGDDRDLADAYRATLAVANGEYFDAAPLELPGGAKAGYVYGYQGRASWALAVVYDGVAPGEYRLEAVLTDGRRLPAFPLAVEAGGDGSAGAVIPADYEDVAELRLLDRSGREVAEADVHG